jgi:hypothetical protein
MHTIGPLDKCDDYEYANKTDSRGAWRAVATSVLVHRCELGGSYYILVESIAA